MSLNRRSVLQALAMLATSNALIPSRTRAAAPMRIGVIGAGSLGGTVGSLWVRAGHEVLFSSRHPEELRSMTQRSVRVLPPAPRSRLRSSGRSSCSRFPTVHCPTSAVSSRRVCAGRLCSIPVILPHRARTRSRAKPKLMESGQPRRSICRERGWCAMQVASP
jgi:hypothetical protein